MKRREFLGLTLGSGAAAAVSPAARGGSIQVGGPDVLSIGGSKQLLLDDHVVESLEPRVYRVLNQPVKHPDNPVIPLAGPWENQGALSHGGDAGKVFYDEDQKLFRFYGWMTDWAVKAHPLFYAESSDGLHWAKPRLGQTQYLGHDTNFIHLPFASEGSGNVAILKDPAARDEGEKYKMLYHRRSNGQWGLYPAHSPDGLGWTPVEGAAPVVRYGSDTNNNLIWDAPRRRYLAYLRAYVKMNRWFQTEPVYPEDARSRTPVWASSPDFLHWDAPLDKGEPDEKYVCFHTDRSDPVGSRDFYTLEVLPYEGGFVGFTSVYHNMFGEAPAALDTGKARTPWMDRMDVQLLWSRDGQKFQRMGDRRVFLPYGPENSWDADLVYTVQAPVVRPELGEIWIYYEGFSGRHWFYKRGQQQRGQIGLAILRLDGFVSLTGHGALTTRPLLFQGSRLFVNASGIDRYAGAGYGTLAVEILDGQTGRPLAGFNRQDSDPFGGDSLDRAMTWKGNPNLGALEGKPIRLRFHLERAKLFAFRFGPESSG